MNAPLGMILCIRVKYRMGRNLFIYRFICQTDCVAAGNCQCSMVSVGYLYMLSHRRSTQGQTKLIAVCKWIGTLAPTLIGVIEQNTFIIVTGIICFVLDGLYFCFLLYVSSAEGKIQNSSLSHTRVCETISVNKNS